MPQKLLFYLALMFAPMNFSSATLQNADIGDPIDHLYQEMALKDIVDPVAFRQAITGYYALDAKRKDVFTLIDFSKPSTQERLYVFDMNQRKLVHRSVVAHGKNSGENYATSFSNIMGSHKSSLGFYTTENTYIGKHGYSLILNGLEEGINHLAKQRAIVIHSAAYANPSIIKSAGRLGRSFGCPALPEAVSKNIINTIKDGTLLFIYAADKNYVAQSRVMASYYKVSQPLASLD